MYVASVFSKCFSCFTRMLHLLQWLYTYVSNVCSKCFTSFRRMLQIFYLDVAYIAVVIHICCKRMFQVFHLVSVCCNRCCSRRALTHGQACAAPGAPAPPGMVSHDGACSRLNTCACALCFLPLSRIGACALLSLSHWGAHTVIPLSHVVGVSLACIGARALCSLSRMGERALCSLSLVCSWAGPHTCCLGQAQQQ
jgi:hypothetical protein